MLRTWPNYARYAERTDRVIPVFLFEPLTGAEPDLDQTPSAGRAWLIASSSSGESGCSQRPAGDDLA